MMKLVFISVGMSGRSEEDVVKDLTRAEENLYDIFSRNSVAVWDNYNVGDFRPRCMVAKRYCIAYLSEALHKLSQSDACYFVKGWQNYENCRIEMEVCKTYGIKIIEEE